MILSKWRQKKQIEEKSYSSRSSFLHSHHHTLGRWRTTYIMQCLESVKTYRLNKSTGVNFRSHARQQSSSQGSSFTRCLSDLYSAESKHRDWKEPTKTATKSTWNKFAQEGMNVYPLPADGDYYQKRICHVMMSIALWKKILLKVPRILIHTLDSQLIF